MRQYDLIWVPVQREGEIAEGLGPMNDPVMGLESRIVLTIEELREVWNAGCQAMSETIDNEFDEDHVMESPDFETYLQSKGIKL